MTTTVGHFTLDDADVLSGPGDYMTEQGSALADRIVAGEDTVFNMTAHLSPDVRTALLVRLQTDYAGWLGMKQTKTWFKTTPRRARAR
jgi:hypothetical protein